MMADEPMVSYPISEVLRQISDKIDRLGDLLTLKADKAELEALTVRVTANEQQVKVLLAANVAEATNVKARQEWRKWIVPVVLSVLTIVVMALQIWHP